MATNIENDFLRFKKEIEQPALPFFKIDATIDTLFKKNHNSIYVIALILTKLEKAVKQENKVIFLVEILSDLLSLTKLSFIGFETASLIILRRVIENFYNHIYYFDHPVEYDHLNSGKNEYTPMKELKSYFETHPIFFKSMDKTIKEFNDILFQEYHLLCKVVHSKGRDSMNLSKSLQDLNKIFSMESFLQKAIKVELYIIYLSYKFHRNLKFTPTENDLIVEIIPKNKRNNFSD